MAIETDLAPETPELDFTQQPGYIVAADVHNVATGNGSWFSSAVESISNAPKFWSLAIGSGATGILNSGIAIANLFNSEEDKIAEVNYGKWVQEYDADLGKYYRENADSIDTWGFVASSFVPGMAGVKALNVGQKYLQVAAKTGNMGPLMSRATSLLTPQADSYMKLAAEQLAATNSTFKFMNANVMKAIGMKTGQQALEAAAFEGAVLASSFKSPFLEDMEASDIAVNFATGVLLGGGIGGVLSVPGVRSAVRSQVKALDEVGNVGLFQAAMHENTPSGVQLGNHFQNRKVLENFIADSEAKLDAPPEGLTREIITRNITNARSSIAQANNSIRTKIREITADKPLGNYFADNIIALRSDDGLAATLGAESILRAANVRKRATGIDRVQQNLFELAGGPRVEDDGRILWTKFFGSNKGAVLEELPDAIPLADKVKLKGSNDSIANAIERQVKSKRFRIDEPLDALAHNNLDNVQLRYAWASKVNIKPREVMTVNQNDIPLMEAIERQRDNFKAIKIVDDKGNEVKTVPSNEFTNEIVAAKDRVAAELIKGKKSVEEVAERTNMNSGYIAGTEVSQSTTENYFYKQFQANQLNLDNPADVFNYPMYMGIKNNKDIDGLMNEFGGDAESLIRSFRKAAQTTTDIAVAEASNIYGQADFINPANGKVNRTSFAQMLPDAEVVNDAILNADRFGSGARVFSFSNGNYGTTESMMQFIGSLKQRMDIEAANIIETRLTPALNALRNNTGAAAEFGITKELIARTSEKYVLRDGKLRLKKLVDWEDSGGTAPRPTFAPGVKEEITFQFPETRSVWEAHIDLNGARLAGKQKLRAAQGKEFTLDPSVAYTPKPDPSKLQYFAFVVDDTLTGAGKTSMIHARDATTLEKMINKTRQEFPQFRIVLKSDAEDYYRAKGQYEYDKTLHDNYIDTALASRGINSQFLPKTDGEQLANELLDWHKKEARFYNSDLITTKYETAFRELESMGRSYGGIQTSKYPDAVALATETKKNPYVEYMKTALNISNVSEYPLLTGVNQALDSVVSKLWNQAGNLMQRAKSPEDLEVINNVFQQHGFKTAYYDAATELLANHRVDSNVMTKFVRGANSLLATTFLRMDFLNAVNNKLGSVILTSTELRHVLSQISKGSEETVGKLAQLTRVKVPGTDETILSPQKLIMRSLQNFTEDVIGKKNVLTERYKANGWIADIGEIQKLADSLTVNGTESALKLNQKLRDAFDSAKKIGDFGEKWTGNKLIETMNRFMAADIMRQITDVGVEAGILSTKEASTYINTFVNRTQVNMVAAQRPLAFQGPIGMAIGLFQSYQFNLMQQLLRYAIPGSRKDIAMLGAMQSSIYGLNGLPGFQQFNEHIIAQAAGNHVHNDVYSQLYGDLNYDVANFFLYGVPSNLLQANLYVRGDLTPQHPTVLPGSISEIPVVGKMGAFFGNIFNTIGNIAGGQGIKDSLLSGLEHNSLNRPLAGLAQVLRGVSSGTGQVVSTAKDGQFLSANDLFSLTTLARLGGGRPLDESVFRDQAYRIQAYASADQRKRNELGNDLTRAFSQGEGEPDIGRFMERYIELGGKQAGFNKWMMNNYLKATTNRAADLKKILSDPYSARLQAMMGGIDESTFSIVAQQ